MSVCKRYCSNDEEAVEILNDGFLHVFRKIQQYEQVYDDVLISFKEWLGQILLDTVIDHCREQNKLQPVNSDHIMYPLTKTDGKTIEEISPEKIIDAIRNLSPLYRTVFNLYVIEQMDHDLIAKRLDISVDASRINLSKARNQLRKIVFEEKKSWTECMIQSR